MPGKSFLEAILAARQRTGKADSGERGKRVQGQQTGKRRKVSRGAAGEGEGEKEKDQEKEQEKEQEKRGQEERE